MSATADYTTTGFLASVKRRVMLAVQNETFDDADILAIATEELQSYVFPFLMSVREEYAVASTDITFSSSTALYELPEAATGDKVRDVLLLRDGKYFQLDRIEPERLQDHALTSPQPYGFMFVGTRLQLVPAPTSTGTVRVNYFHRPGWLIPTSKAALITSVSGTTVGLAGNLPNSALNSRISVVSGRAPYYTVGSGTIATNTSPTSKILSFNAQTAGAEVGDYLCYIGESPIPQVPIELHPLLVARTVYSMYVAQGDPRAQEAKANADRLQQTLLTVLTPRSEGSARYIINRHAPGWRHPSWRTWRT